MEIERAIKILQRQIERIAEVRNYPRFSTEWFRWKRDTELAIEKIFGFSNHLVEFQNISYSSFLPAGLESESQVNAQFQDGLNYAEALLKSFIGELQDYGLPQNSKGAIEELAKLKDELRKKNYDGSHAVEIQTITEAEFAVKNKDQIGFIKKLKTIGSSVLDSATKIGTTILTELIKKSMGI